MEAAAITAMVCSRGESPTHHKNQMTQETRTYNHNVDIKSTQLKNGIEATGKFALQSVAVIISCAFTLYVGGGTVWMIEKKSQETTDTDRNQTSQDTGN